MSVRPIKKLVKAKPTLEGAGVRLRRAFGFGNTSDFDPFLLLDDFRNDRPEDYLAGFPWHPHRGIETITYVLAGTVEHADSMGNRGAIAAGDVQWMTAGSGIIHQEMPKGDRRRAHARLSAVGEPSRVAQDDGAALPGGEGAPTSPSSRTTMGRGCASFAGPSGERRTRGRRRDRSRSTSTSRFPPGKRKIAPGRNDAKRVRLRVRGRGKVLQCVGAALACPPKRRAGRTRSLPRTPTTDRWCSSTVATRSPCRPGDEGIRFLLVSGKPLAEPVAWYGPIVMNTQEELRQAFEELERGTFLKSERTR